MARIIILTDKNYLEPAFVTVLSVCKKKLTTENLTLIYLEGPEDEKKIDFENIELIKKFVEITKNTYPNTNFNSITLNSKYFSHFEKYHFNRSNLQKLVFAEIFKNEEICLSVDAGMILGDEFKKIIQEVNNDSNFTVKAFTQKSDALLTNSQLKKYHHDLYPAGGILAFNNWKFKESNLLNRLLVNFDNYKTDLIYPEQDLMCMTLTENELVNFRSDYTFYNLDMALGDNWGKDKIQNYENIYISGKYLYMKHIGLFKPWLKWVLNPLKSIYLNEISIASDCYSIFNETLLRSKHIYFNENVSKFLVPQLDLLEKYCSITESSPEKS